MSRDYIKSSATKDKKNLSLAAKIPGIHWTVGTRQLLQFEPRVQAKSFLDNTGRDVYERGILDPSAAAEPARDPYRGSLGECNGWEKRSRVLVCLVVFLAPTARQVVIS